MIPAGLKRDDTSSNEEEEDDPPKKQSSNVTTTTTNNNKKKNTSRVTFQTTTETNNDEDKKFISTDSTDLHNNNNYKTNHEDEDDNNHPSRNTNSTSSSLGTSMSSSFAHAKEKSSIRNETNMEEKECSTTNSNNSRQAQNHETSSSSSASLMTILVERIRQETQELYPDTNASIADPDLILHLLQLSAGDIQVAMDFFWDHYLATASTIATTTTKTTTATTDTSNTNQVHKRKRSPIHPPMAAAAKQNDDDNDDDDDADEEDAESSTRRIRLEQNNPPPNNENVPMPPLHEQPLLPPPAPIRNLPLNDDQLMDNNNEIQNNNNNDPNPQPPQNIQDAAEILDADENQEPIVESVSISDDEGVWRMERRQRPFIPGLYAQRNHRIRPESNGYSIQPFANLESQQPQPVASDQEVPDDDDDDDDGDDMDDDSTYISEDDWCTSNSTGINTKQDPSKILWGRNSNNRTTTGSNPAPNHDDANNNNNAAPSAEAATPPIPRTWMYAGFQMAKDGGGLTLKPPSDDELIDQLYQLQQQNVGGKKLPFHCKSLTIILSIVQAIMLTGATVQVNTVDCTSLQTSFAELSQDQRIQQFNRRLEDAIVALLFVAIQASTARKQRIIQNRQNKKRHRAGSKTSKNDNQINQDFELMQQQRMTRRLRLCPTCQWSEDSVPTEGSQDSNSNNPIQVITTLTHRSDLRYYVKSNLKQFQSSRGCALLLETIVRIHGQGTVDQMIRKSRRKCGLSMDPSLISCSCHADSSKANMASDTNKSGVEMRNATNNDNEEKEEKEKDSKEKEEDTKEKDDDTKEKDDDTKEKDTHKDVDVVDSAPFHRQECASIELMSLLICGEVHSTFHGWSSGPLGFGILSKLEDISDDLTKPFKPVWILRGDMVHSLAWVPTEKLPIHFDIDQPGAIFPVSHWNPWYEPILPKQSHFRIHIQRTQWTPPTTITPSSAMRHREKQHKAVPGMFVKNKSGIVENKENKPNATQMPITIQSNPNKSRHCHITVEHHPDDLRFYPDTYHRWRFQFHDQSNSNNFLTTTTTTNEDDDPIRLSIWIFYSSLTSQERDIVDSKWAPPIHTILKSRWPKCIIDTLEHAS